MERLTVLEPRQQTSTDVSLLPNLIKIQTESYRWFVDEGLRELFDNFSPVEDYTGVLALEFLDYRVGEPARSLQE